MSTETATEFDLDTITEASDIAEGVAALEESQQPLATLTASVASFKRVQSALLHFRSSNISVLLLLKKTEDFLEDEQIAQIFCQLRDWDQLSVHNFLEICGDWVPKEYAPLLVNEAKVELKWFQEWLTAASDTRIHKYPGLPWRSYLRKVVRENFEFASGFLYLAGLPASPENVQAMQALLKGFIEAKKKVLCIFPKKWGQGGVEQSV